MTDRPTPEQIRQAVEDDHDGLTSYPRIDDYLEALAEQGYVIVHPDDVPESWDEAHPDRLTGAGRRMGWNACRAHIFGADS